MPTKIDLRPYGLEVERGLQNERPRLNDAVMARAFYDYEGRRYATLFQRDAETVFDFLGRPYRPAGFVREVVDVLTEHLYCPGPTRTWSDAGGQKFLEQVYGDNHLDALMLRADQLSTLEDVCAIQIDAGESAVQRFSYICQGMPLPLAATSPAVRLPGISGTSIVLPVIPTASPEPSLSEDR